MTSADQNAVRLSREGGVLVLSIANPPLNALGVAVRRGLAAGLAEGAANADVTGIVIRAEGRTFPVGADIAEFGKPPAAPSLPEICNRIEACPKPVVAALHGTALGGGLELALAAHYRVADAGAQLGLPEVNLGILPGAGGTQRLPRLIGAEHALRLMLTGQPVGAAEALALGMIDQVVEGGVDAAALAIAARARPRPTRDRMDGLHDAGSYFAAVAAARAQQRGARLPGPGRIIDCVEAAHLLPFDQGLAFERSAFDDLVATPEAAGLRYAFFAERAAARMPEAGAVARPLGAVAVAGAAGAGLVHQLLQAGFAVTLCDPDRPALVGALELIAAEQEAMVAAGRLTNPDRDADWARLLPTLGLEALAAADLVFVAAPPLLPELAQIARPGAVLVTLGRAGGAGARAADTLGVQFAPMGARLAEVIAGPASSPEAVATLVALLRQLKRVVVRTTAPGDVGARVMAAGRAAALHLAGDVGDAAVSAALAEFGLAGLVPLVLGARSDRNARAIRSRVLAAMANEGARLVGQGIAQRPSDIDVALVLGHGFPRWEGGPMHWADTRGLLVLRQDLRHWAAEMPDLWSVAPLIDELISVGLTFGDMNAG